MRELGYVEGRSVLIEWRFADGDSERLPLLAAELVQSRVDVILAAGTQAISTAQKATTSIPVVMAGANDPVGSGFVASLAHPGGNITGLSLLLEDITPKQLEILLVVVPRLSRLAVLANPANASYATLQANVEAVAREAGVDVLAVQARTPGEIENAFSTMAQKSAGAVIVVSDAFFTQQIRQITMLAEKNRLPLIGPFRQYAEAGALMSYGQNFTDHFRQAATYVDKILRGAKPADLPVEQPTKFELVINLKTARLLGLSVPNQLLLRADETVER
jgi:putative ABC transport system substrate-binding protein